MCFPGLYLVGVDDVFDLPLPLLHPLDALLLPLNYPSNSQMRLLVVPFVFVLRFPFEVSHSLFVFLQLRFPTITQALQFFVKVGEALDTVGNIDAFEQSSVLLR